MKKIFSVILILTTILTISGCNQKNNTSSDINNSTSSDKNNSSVAKAQNNSDKDTSGNIGSTNKPSLNNSKGKDKSGVTSTENYSPDGYSENGLFEINSLDKLNFYSAKRAIAQSDYINLSANNQKNNLITLTDNRNYSILNLAKNINSNSVFTITMYCYFTVKLTDSNGFLAQKLGGTGTVEVVITKNNFENMITFKKGDRYYSCLQNSNSEKTMSFSTHKYVEGFSLVENYDQENYEFTVYFEGDKVLGMNSGRFASSGGNFHYNPDGIEFVDNYCFVIHKKQSFTATQLEKLFASNNSFFEDTQGIIASDGATVFGASSITDSAVAIKSSNGNTVLTNSEITNAIAKFKKNYGYYTELQLTTSGYKKLTSALNNAKNSNFSLYINNTLFSKITLNSGISKGNACITNFKSKAEMTKLYNKLTAIDISHKIGRIVDEQSFKTEMSKRMNLSDYSIENMGNSQYRYSLNSNKRLEYKKSNYEVTIDGVRITLPIKVSDLLDKGFKIAEDHFQEVGLSGGLTFENKNGNQFLAYTMNFYQDAFMLEDCYVTQILFSCYEGTLKYQEGISPDCPVFEMFGGINKNSSIDDVIAKLGKPNEIYLQTTYNPAIEYKSAHIILNYFFSTPELPDGMLTLNFFPVLNNDTPSDFLTDADISFQVSTQTVP